MASLTIEFGTKSKAGERSVRFIIQHNGRKERIATGVTVKDSELTAGKRIKNVAKGMAVEKMRRELEDRLTELMPELMTMPDVDVSYIKERLMRRGSQVDFFDFADRWLARTSIKGRKNYATMLNGLETYLGHRRLLFSDITYQFLTGYEAYLNGRTRAQSLYLGQFRHLFREAMREYNTDYEQVIKNDPFLRYRVPKQQIKKGVRALTLEQLLKVYAYQGLPHGRAQLARDCFILSFCLMGMNSVDLHCSDAVLKKDVLCYHRTKTKDRRSDGAYIEVKIHPFIKELVKKYRGVGHVFNFSKRYKTAEDFNRALNIGLKEIGKAVKIDGLQFYQARHTFATLSRNMMRFSKSDVDEALNHVGTMDIADIYIAKDFSIINENNFKLIECVFGKEDVNE